jgi:hypothetical protein
LVANTPYYLAVVKRGDDTSAGVNFDLNIYQYVSVNQENFDSPTHSLPSGWSETQGTGSLGWRVATTTELSGVDYVVPSLAGANQVVGVVWASGCTNGTTGTFLISLMEITHSLSSWPTKKNVKSPG